MVPRGSSFGTIPSVGSSRRASPSDDARHGSARAAGARVRRVRGAGRARVLRVRRGGRRAAHEYLHARHHTSTPSEAAHDGVAAAPRRVRGVRGAVQERRHSAEASHLHGAGCPSGLHHVGRHARMAAIEITLYHLDRTDNFTSPYPSSRARSPPLPPRPSHDASARAPGVLIILRSVIKIRSPSPTRPSS